MEDKERIQEKSSINKKHPREGANIFSILFFCWALPFFVKGFKKPIAEEDLYGPLKAHSSEILGDKLEKAWIDQIKNHEKPLLWKALWKVFGKEITLFGFVVLVQELIVKMVQPIALGKLLSYYVPHQTTVTKNEAYFYCALIVLVSLINVMIVHSNMLGLIHLGMKLRVACCSLIYRKCLKLSKSAMVETTVGQMVNLLANDVNRFDTTMLHFHHIWLGPLATFVIIYMLYTTIDAAALAGVVALLLFIPLQVFMGKKTSQYRLRIAIRTDKRIRLMNEIISGIQVIKMYTWEKPFAKLVELARKMEIKQIRATSYIRAFTASFLNYLNRVAIYFCVIAYVLSGNRLKAQYVFVVTSYYNILRQSLTIWFPRGFSALAETNISVQRIQKFLMYDEVKTKRNTDTKAINGELKNGIEAIKPMPLENKGSISMKNVAVKWSSNISDYTLSNIDFEVEPNQLVAIVGPVGSGKSTLLHVILEELRLLEGTLDIKGTISYASQEAWLFPGSIRQNILFGEEMDEKKYNQVIQVCALERDLSLFPFGDRTLIGEKGVMLSGGQKARINLARAVYKNADIYLLDDPLSAVDTHVGKQLFDHCIAGFLKNKCVVLVTHQLQYLKTVDKIFLLEHGTITMSGKYKDLQNNEGEFARLLQHQSSVTEDETIESLKKRKDEKKEKPELPTEIKEQRSTGTVSREIYKKYIRAGNNLCHFWSVIVLFVLAQLFGISVDYFLTFWVNMEQKRLERSLENGTFILENQTLSSFDQFVDTFFTSENCTYIYTAVICCLIIFTIGRSLSIFTFCMTASQNLHNRMFEKIVRIPMRFFHTNPSGRILNRFSKDMGYVDEALPITIVDTLHVGLTVLSIATVVASVTPWILIPTVIIFCIFYVYRLIFLRTSRNLKRVEGICRSPIFTHLTASLQGLTTIRAFAAEKVLRLEFDNHQDLHSSAFYMYMGCNRAFGFYLDLNCVIYIALVCFSFLLIGNEIYGGNVGLAITQSLTLTGMLQWGIRQWSDLENQMTSVERITEYTEMDPENDSGAKKPSTFWPYEGNIEFKNVSMRYALGEPVVLRDLSFKIAGEEKIGIVGRTGAGKSSLISALFRLAEIEGNIIIDDYNTKEIPLSVLRSKISIIPQEPVLFSGTLRKNLDPFDEYDDGILWNALEEVELRHFISDMPSGLQCNVSEGGSNFSVGQRQLLCLARAVIRDNKILVLDEATANVDPQTDELIQSTIRRKFHDCTVLTIAHRLHTIMDSDKVLVMDAGAVAEFDHPHLLLQNQDGIFYGLVKQTGRNMAEKLMKIAEENYKGNKYY